MADEFHLNGIAAAKYSFIDCDIEQLERLFSSTQHILALLEHAKKGVSAIRVFQTRIQNVQIVRSNPQSVKSTAAARYAPHSTDFDLSTVDIVFFVDLITYVPLVDIKTLVKHSDALHKATSIHESRNINPKWSTYYTTLMSIDENWARLFLNDVQIHLATSDPEVNQLSEARQDAREPNEQVNIQLATIPAPQNNASADTSISEQAASTMRHPFISSNPLDVNINHPPPRTNPIPSQIPAAYSSSSATESVRTNTEKEEQMYIRAIAAKQKAWGPDHPTTLSTMIDLGSLYASTAKIADAEEMYIRALRGYVRVKGRYQTEMLDVLGKLQDLHGSR